MCVCVCVFVCVCVCVCLYFGSISSLIQISLNIIDIFCLHIFLLILSYWRIDFIVFGGDNYKTILKVKATHCNNPDALLLTKY